MIIIDLRYVKKGFYGEVILVLGTRKQESSRRNRTMEILEKKRVRELLIGKNFYKNEKDATQFYSDMMSRKKEHGGKYNEKFLDFQPLESEFEDDEEG